MKAKFEEFNDGIVDVYDVNSEEKLKKAKTGLRFGNETVGLQDIMQHKLQIPVWIVLYIFCGSRI